MSKIKLSTKKLAVLVSNAYLRGYVQAMREQVPVALEGSSVAEPQGGEGGERWRGPWLVKLRDQDKYEDAFACHPYYSTLIWSVSRLYDEGFTLKAVSHTADSITHLAVIPTCLHEASNDDSWYVSRKFIHGFIHEREQFRQAVNDFIQTYKLS